MTELRIILLVAGVLFIAGIAGFEWWRGRRNRAVATPAREESSAVDAPAAGHRAPLPEINVVRDQRVQVNDSLPVIELDSTSASGTRRALGISISDDVAVDVPQPTLTPTVESTEPRRTEPFIGSSMDLGGDEISAVRIVPEPSEESLRGPQIVLSWPSEAERRIVTLRLVPRGDPRFAGRALRQAFASTGFWHGPLDIFHLPDDQGRVIVSAAALAQPGTFDPSIMDSQRFSGLNLFAVLPGPLAEREAFDELVHAARTLAERLDAAITDQHGEELTAQRIGRLRQSLEDPVQARAAGEG